MRREFLAKVRIAAFKRADGHCEQCTARLIAGKYTYDHILPDWLGGEPTLENCQVICATCDGLKTHKQDQPRIAKTKRQRAAHIGAKTSSRPMPGSKASGWRKPINGPAERRT